MKFRTDMLNSVRDIYTNRYDPEGVHVFARIYWRVLLTTAFLILIASMAYGEWDLYGVLRDLGNVPERALPSPVLERASLNATLVGFEERRSAYEALRARQGAQVPDPSR